MRLLLLILLLIALLMCGFAKAESCVEFPGMTKATTATSAPCFENLYEMVLGSQDSAGAIPQLYSQLVERLTQKQNSEAFEVFWRQAIQSNWASQDLRILKAVLTQWQDLYPSQKADSRAHVLRDLNADKGLDLFDPAIRNAVSELSGANFGTDFYILKNYRPLEKKDLEDLKNEEARFVIFSKQRKPIGFWGKISELKNLVKEFETAEAWMDTQTSTAGTSNFSFKEPMPEESRKSWVRPISVAVGIGVAVLAASYLKNKSLVIRR